MFWGGQCCLISIGGAGSYLPAHNIPNKKKSMIDRTLATPNEKVEIFEARKSIKIKHPFSKKLGA